MRDLCPYNVNCHLQLKHPNTPDRNLRDDRDQRSQGKDTKDSGRTIKFQRRDPGWGTPWYSLIQRFFFNFIEIPLMNKTVRYLNYTSDPRFLSRQSAFSYKC